VEGMPMTETYADAPGRPQSGLVSRRDEEAKLNTVAPPSHVAIATSMALSTAQDVLKTAEALRVRLTPVLRPEEDSPSNPHEERETPYASTPVARAVNDGTQVNILTLRVLNDLLDRLEA
jgi:hypothetical protein